MVNIKWHLQAKQVENRIDLCHNSSRDERETLKVNKHHKHLWLKLNDTYILNK